MRTSLARYNGRAWRLTSQWSWPKKNRTFTRAASSSIASPRHSFFRNDHQKGSIGSSSSFYHNVRWRDSRRAAAATTTLPLHRHPALWLLWPRWVSTRMAPLRAAAAQRAPLPPGFVHAILYCRGGLEWVLAAMERPVLIGAAGAVTAVRIATQLTGSLLLLMQEVYLQFLGPRLRRALRFALGVPFLVGTLFLLQMKDWYFPEVGTGLDTSCVASLSLCHSVEEALTHATVLQMRYRRLFQQRKEESEGRQHQQQEQQEGTTTTTSAEGEAGASSMEAHLQSSPRTTTLLLRPLTRKEENELLKAIFVLLRSIETQIVGTAEERELITPRVDVMMTAAPDAGAAPPHSSLGVPQQQPSAAATTVELEDIVTATPHMSESASATTFGSAAAATVTSSVVGSLRSTPSTDAILVSPAEYILRVIMAIAIAEGWADITEHTRVLFQELVRNKTPPVQSHIVQAVGELCSLSYELESGQMDAITLDQRKRIAAAIDAFRPERSVMERCTIAHEITILPLPDFDHTTRCLGMIRKSPGRKPQLILCFVGSNSKRNWLTNFNFWPVPLPARYGVVGAPLPGDRASRVAQPQVHRGFLGLVQTVPYKEVAADFDHVLLVGHSLGGALAQLAGLELAAERPSRRITVITMASPRVLAVDWRSRLRMAGRRAWEHRGDTAKAPHGSSDAAVEPFSTPRPGEANERDMLAEVLTTPANYRHFRGFLQSDVVPHLPPEFLHFTHSGQRIPLNTGCATSLSFMAWGMYSKLYHSADLYQSVLKQPIVSQTHWYVEESEKDEEASADVEQYVHMNM